VDKSTQNLRSFQHVFADIIGRRLARDI